MIPPAETERVCAQRGVEAACVVGELLLTRLREDAQLAQEDSWYRGRAGIAWFLVQLGRASAQPRFELAGRALCDELCSRRHTASSLADGAFGVAWTLVSLAEQLGEPRWTRAAARQLDSSAIRSFLCEAPVEFLGGVAGGCLALLALYLATRNESVLALLELSVARLVASARAGADGGLFFHADRHEVRPLLGLAHGAAGVALTLLELARCSGQRGYTYLALEALAYERAHNQRYGSFQDLRVFAEAGTLGDAYARADLGAFIDGQGRSSAWCSGAVGSAMVRLVALEKRSCAALREELEAALGVASGTARRRARPRELGLCHGVGGDVELLLEAARQLKRDELAQRARALLSPCFALAVLRSDLRQMDCGLLTGSAGVGTVLLRAFAPNPPPSPLCPRIPRGHKSEALASRLAFSVPAAVQLVRERLSPRMVAATRAGRRRTEVVQAREVDRAVLGYQAQTRSHALVYARMHALRSAREACLTSDEALLDQTLVTDPDARWLAAHTGAQRSGCGTLLVPGIGTPRQLELTPALLSVLREFASPCPVRDVLRTLRSHIDEAAGEGIEAALLATIRSLTRAGYLLPSRPRLSALQPSEGGAPTHG